MHSEETRQAKPQTNNPTAVKTKISSTYVCMYDYVVHYLMGRCFDRRYPHHQVVIQEDESSIGEEGVGQFFPFRETMLVKSIMIVGYGNTVNDWNRWALSVCSLRSFSTYIIITYMGESMETARNISARGGSVWGSGEVYGAPVSTS